MDASAIVAIVTDESDAASLSVKLMGPGKHFTSPLAMYEAALGIARVLDISPGDAWALTQDLLSTTQTEIVSISPDLGFQALEAHTRFGKGRHPARLNMGDCFAYACAQALDVPLLFKGDDFALTDIPAA